MNTGMEAYSNISSIFAENFDISQLLIPNTIIISIGILLSICGNSMVMFIHWRKLNSLKNFRMFIPFLALSDSLAAIICSSASIYQNFNWYTWTSKYLCKLAWFSMSLVQTNSAILLFAIAVQRYLRICHPLRRPMKYRKKIGLLLFALCFLGFESIPFIYFSDVVTHDDVLTNSNVSECRMLVNAELIHTVYRYADDIFILIIVVIVTVLYIKSGLVLSVLSKKATQSNIRHNNNKLGLLDKTQVPEGLEYIENSVDGVSRSFDALDSSDTYGTTERVSKPKRMTRLKCRKYRNINIMFIVISFTAFFVYTPRTVFNILELHSTHFWFRLSKPELRLWLAIKRWYLIMYCVNPFIYSIMDYQFRRELKKMFCRLETSSE